MADQPDKKQVPMNTADVPQHKRLAAGDKCDGQYVPTKTQGVDKQVTKPKK